MSVTVTTVEADIVVNETGAVIAPQQVVATIAASTRGIPGPPGESSGGVPLHIGDTQPAGTDPWVWFDTSGGNLQIKYEDGL